MAMGKNFSRKKYFRHNNQVAKISKFTLMKNSHYMECGLVH